MTDLSSSEEPWLLAVAAAVSEGEAVDWAAARAKAHDAHTRSIVDELFYMSRLVRASGGEPAPAPARPPATAGRAAAQSEPARAWRGLLILDRLASGVYGEVHRGWDTQLDREVAVKFLRERGDGTVTSLREARLLARIHHPNVVTVYGAEQENGESALWMELIDGETLAHVVQARGPLSPREAAGVGIDVCRALSALHAHGLVHRDIKAANVMREVGGRIVLMDFGGAHGVDDAHPPRLQGTPLYMAPELLSGERASVASDIYALGVLLFFLLTGKHPVEADTVGELGEAHARDTRTRLRDARADLPDALARVVERAASRDRGARFQTVGELEHALSGTLGEAPGARQAVLLPAMFQSRPALATAAIAGLIAIAVLAGVAASAWRARAAATAPVVATHPAVFDLVLPESIRLENDVSDARVSPDGRVVVFTAWTKGTPLLFRRAIDARTIEPIVGTEGGARPFWSPDSRYIGFHANGMLKRVAARGGPVSRVCPVRQFGGGTWSRDGVILFSQLTTLWTVPDGGGAPTRLPTPPGLGSDAVLMAPTFLADHRSYTYRVGFGERDVVGTYVARLGESGATRLFDLGTSTVVGATHVAFVQDRNLWVQAFDPRTRQLAGTPTKIEDDVLENVGQRSSPGVSMSDTGVFVYRKRRMSDARVASFDASGRERESVDAPQACRSPELSLEGSHLAVECYEAATGRWDIWLLHTEGGPPLSLTAGAGGGTDAVWSPDGETLAFSANPEGIRHLYTRRRGTSDAPKLLWSSPFTKYPSSWSRDGARIAFTSRGATTGWDIWMLSTATGQATPFTEDPDDEIEPQFSPDGQWVAYSSNRSGRWAVYLRKLDAPAAAALQVSAGAGESDPRWSPTGDALFFLAGDRRLVAVPIHLAGTPTIGAPADMFTTSVVGPIGLGVRFNYAVHPNGWRFVMMVSSTPGELPGLTVRTGWPAAAATPR